MEEQNLEEEIDILEYAYNNLEDTVAILKDLPSEKYNIIVSQIQELLNDVDYILTEKQEQLDLYDEQQFIEARIERYEKKIECNKD